MPMPIRALPSCLFLALAAALLAMTLAWHVPMMLWDHLDLVPLLEALRNGERLPSQLLRIYGGHMLTAAYGVLLATTTLSGGQTWLDCLVSWVLLVAAALLLRSLVRDAFPTSSRRDLAMAALLVLLALHPGHLANLQWGWQVAVFLCLAGVIACVHQLTRPQLGWGRLVTALAAAGLACFGFATAIAILPVALLLVWGRHDLPPRQRALMTLPWLAACLVAAAGYLGVAASHGGHDPLAVIHYTLNFLGSGVARFATDLAPLLALAGLGLVAWLAPGAWRERGGLPWLALAVFGLLAGLLVALGRAEPFGAEQAFVTRYVSFSVLFWLGLAGLLGRRWRDSGAAVPRVALAVLATFATANALHMVHKARKLGLRTAAIAQEIRATWPNVDRGLLGEIYFDQPEIAAERLERLHAWGYAPFDR
ncbi:MAG: hypothetical protein J0H15_06940 [Xanthomonadales bacterium]|nr:hypothetical protein [Xanthomonadales bacterium]